MSRKRKIDDDNPPPKRKRESHGRGTVSPKSVSPSQRVREHSGECLTVSSQQLFCTACREELSLISSVINNHIKSAKHDAGKNIAEALKSSDPVTHLVGETLTQEQRIYRVKVVTAFLRAAIPLNKVESLRDLLEENGFR